MDKFQNKYRIGSARLKKWDYRNDAAYFITICTQGRECFFEGITDGKMNLSAIGIIADVLWYEITNHTKNVELGSFVVMPNHIHGIIELDNSKIPEQNRKVHSFQGMIPKSLASIVKGYKIGVTKWFRKNSDIE